MAVIERSADIMREYGPFPGVSHVHGLTFDGQHVWFAAGDRLNAFDPESGTIARSIDVPGHAGTAFDGRHLFQIAEQRIQKIDPQTGRVLATIPAPGNGGDSGLAWAEGTLWIGQYRERKFHQIDPETGAILRTIESNRFVTGVTWLDGELWHGTWEGDQSELRRIDPATGAVQERLEMPAGVGISGLESNGSDRFFCGGGPSGKVRAVRRPKSAGARRTATQRRIAENVSMRPASRSARLCRTMRRCMARRGANLAASTPRARHASRLCSGAHARRDVNVLVISALFSRRRARNA